MKLAALATVMCLTGMASAQTVDWNKDPMAGFMAPEKDGGIVAAARGAQRKFAVRSPEGDEIKPENIAAEAIPQRNKGEISGEFLDDAFPAKNLIVNNTKDKVGGTYTVCGQQMYGGGDQGPECDTVSFEFPQLRYDADNKRFLLWTELVAENHWFSGIKLTASFKLAAKLETVVDRSGFDTVTRHFVTLYLVRTGL